MIDIVYSTDDIIRTLPYHYCSLEDDYTLSFGSEFGRSGGFYLKKDFFENNYEKEVAEQLIRFKKEDVVFYNKIIKMVQEYSGDYIGLYFSTFIKKKKPEIKIIDGNEYIEENKKLKEKIEFCVKVLKRIKYEVHDYEWKKKIDEAILEISGEEEKPTEKASNKTETVEEICPHCDTVNEIPSVMGIYKCSSCGGFLVSCSNCTKAPNGCKDCSWRLNEENIYLKAENNRLKDALGYTRKLKDN